MNVNFAPPPVQPPQGYVDPNEIARRQELAQALEEASSGIQNIQSPWQGLAQLTSAAFGGFAKKRAADDEATNKKALIEAISGTSDGSPLSQEKLALVMALNPDLGMGLMQQQRGKAEEAGNRKRAAEALSAMGLTDQAHAVMSGVLSLDDASNMLQDRWKAPAGPDVKGESNLRTEYNGINTVKDYGLQTQAYQRVLDSARDPSPAGDLALIFNYMKVLDPGSTVREGEFATAQNSGSVPEQIWAMYNKAMTGERLVPEIRMDFVKRAGDLFKGASDLQGRTNDRYSGLATEYNYDPERIVNPIPKIGVLDPSFNIKEYMTPQGEQTKPLPVTNDADYDALPPGATFVGPDGKTRVKPGAM